MVVQYRFLVKLSFDVLSFFLLVDYQYLPILFLVETQAVYLELEIMENHKDFIIINLDLLNEKEFESNVDIIDIYIRKFKLVKLFNLNLNRNKSNNLFKSPI
ncbi:hypothetical protein BpHYR1_036838 [Brachionus plicatilis]|uniref:Uncharacterized protein n=1 Tax=Brachionus plicatilis TaxID=10195 RepID=A0A3M7RGV5_BRAPC|nr:hypothetical protein BpHYR1_036838 [Brachionus plicatilis]